ncbi:MAG: PLP-dependent transferase, partial [bacterium]|nr:PLP-dependent transferase [bacterium]
VVYPDGPAPPDAETIQRLLPNGLYGGIVSFEVKGAGQPEIFRIMDAMRLIVRATSLGDVHSMVLYPVMSSHREVAPKQRKRMGIRDNLLRISAGIEAAEDIIADLDRALEA